MGKEADPSCLQMFFGRGMSSPADTQPQDAHGKGVSHAFQTPSCTLQVHLRSAHAMPQHPEHREGPQGARGAPTAHTEGDTKVSAVIALTHSTPQDRNRNNPTSQIHF